MDNERDPIAEGATDSADLYDVATWESRSWLDAASSAIYWVVSTVAPYLVGLFVLLIVALELLLFGVAVVSFHAPVIGAMVLLSVVPAFGLAAYIWYADVTTSEPLGLLALTFLLGVLFASFAAIVNTLLQPFFVFVPFFGSVLFFYLVVAPVEEVVKWLAVRLYAFRSVHFDAVVDGAVYGAMAGLGFATIENAIYITQSVTGVGAIGAQQIASAGQTAAMRLLAGPGHVIYSAFAGYYLGLAKFNRENAGPIVIKGLLIASFIHATYNTLVSYLGPLLQITGVEIRPAAAFIGFVVFYDGVFAYFLYRKLARYRNAYRQVGMGRSVTFEAADSEDGQNAAADSEDGQNAAADSEDGQNAAADSENRASDGEGSDDEWAESEKPDSDYTDSEESDRERIDTEEVAGEREEWE